MIGFVAAVAITLLPICGVAQATASPPLEQYEPYYVGELGSRWQFPSDHLPVGATLGSFHIALWNVLNKNYLGHIVENDQGLRDSSILSGNVPVRAGHTLTIREQQVGQLILEMIDHPTHPRSMIALQEVHPDVAYLLKRSLPSHWAIVTPPEQPNSQDIFIYDTTVFDYVGSEAVLYEERFAKSIFTLILREKASQKLFRFLQSHIPGGPIKSAEGCAKFAREAMRQYDPAITVVLMGDMNQGPGTIADALAVAALEIGWSQQPYQHLPVAYPTHVDTFLRAAWIDNFFVSTPDDSIEFSASDVPEELCAVLSVVVDVLQRAI